MHLTSVVGTIVGVLKIDQLKVLMVPFLPLVLLVFGEKVRLL
jgi:hypothetical protein